MPFSHVFRLFAPSGCRSNGLGPSVCESLDEPFDQRRLIRPSTTDDWLLYALSAVELSLSDIIVYATRGQQ